MKQKPNPWKKTKRPKALWTKIKDPTFKGQLEQLHPEEGKSGGMKWKSKSKAVADAVYNAINELYATAHPYCDACHKIFPQMKNAPLHFRDDTHHTRGKHGLLYFDTRYFISVCRRAHDWIGNHPDEARALGLLCEQGQWNKEQA